ncbi:MAG TPA: hypothetical protein VI968_03825 [archaeon]|nr:hypothetical protein [archaeon]
MRAIKVAKRALAVTAIGIPVFFAGVAAYNDLTYKPATKRLVEDRPASYYVANFDPSSNSMVAVAQQRAVGEYMAKHKEIPIVRVEDGDRVRTYVPENEPHLLSFRDLLRWPY